MIVACPLCYQVLCLLLSFTASSWTSRLWITWPFGYAGRGYADHFERPWDHHCWRCVNRMHVFFSWIKFVVIEYLGNIPLRDVFQIIAMSHSFGWQIKWSMSSIWFLFLPVHYSLIASTLMSNHFLLTWAGVSAAGGYNTNHMAYWSPRIIFLYCCYSWGNTFEKCAFSDFHLGNGLNFFSSKIIIP